jgi:hypothetical protein
MTHSVRTPDELLLQQHQLNLKGWKIQSKLAATRAATQKTKSIAEAKLVATSAASGRQQKLRKWQNLS